MPAIRHPECIFRGVFPSWPAPARNQDSRGAVFGEVRGRARGWMDCFVAYAPRNDVEKSIPVIASEAKQSIFLLVKSQIGG
jgi:hypothetical protein